MPPYALLLSMGKEVMPNAAIRFFYWTDETRERPRVSRRDSGETGLIAERRIGK